MHFTQHTLIVVARKPANVGLNEKNLFIVVGIVLYMYTYSVSHHVHVSK